MADHVAVTGGVNLSDTKYDVIRQFVEKFLPGLSALYFGLSKIWGEAIFPNPVEVSGTFALIAVFGGVILSMSRKAYDKSGRRYDGEVVADQNEAGENVYRLQLDQSAAESVLNKKQIVFKGLDQTA